MNGFEMNGVDPVDRSRSIPSSQSTSAASSKPSCDSITLLPAPVPLWRRLAMPLADVFFPPSCPVCGERLGVEDQTICRACRASWEPIPRPRCPVCGILEPKRKVGGGCKACPPAPVGFDTARGAFLYRAAAADTVKALKFSSRMALAPVMGLAMLPMFQEEIIAEAGPIDYLIPVPLHFSRRLSRGFNQSALIAGHLSRVSGVPILRGVLHRIRRTRKQTLLDHAERHRNVRNAFAVSNPPQVKNKRLVLIDDVYTTGATINACAVVLKAAGAEAVNAYTFARA